jgi:ABC-type transport system involved in cytochrome bd biosynthesis fused ATPase/permease subunit
MKNIHLISPGKQFNETIQQNQVLIIKNLSYSIPNNNKHILMKNLNLILNQGQRLLITGLTHFSL